MRIIVCDLNIPVSVETSVEGKLLLHIKHKYIDVDGFQWTY